MEMLSNLPSANGTGSVKKVIIGKQVFPGRHFVIGAGAGSKFIGHIYNPVRFVHSKPEATQGVFSADGTTFNKIQMNGNSSCGQIGDVFTFTDVAAGIWLVEGSCGGHKNPKNPFSF